MRFAQATLPPIRDVAEDLREGADYEAICAKYQVSGRTLANRLSYAGYGPDGRPTRVQAQANPLDPRVYGAYVDGGVGGGDYQGLPTETVPHTRKRREFLGLDWSTAPATGPLWRWV